MTVTDGIRLCGHYSSGNPFHFFFLYIYNIKQLWWVIMDAYCSIKEPRSFLVCYMTKWSPVKNVVHLTFFILNLKYKTKFRIKAILNFDHLCCNMSFNVWCWNYCLLTGSWGGLSPDYNKCFSWNSHLVQRNTGYRSWKLIIVVNYNPEA